MDAEQAIVDRSMEIFRKMRQKNDDAVNAALARYLTIIPDQILQGMAQDKIRKFLRMRTDKTLSETELNVLTAQISMQILDELINKVRRRAEINEQRDGSFARVYLDAARLDLDSFHLAGIGRGFLAGSCFCRTEGRLSAITLSSRVSGHASHGIGSCHHSSLQDSAG